MSRSEWHDDEGSMRPMDQVKVHLEYYQRILEQNNLGPFPESFVPCGFRHFFGRGENGLVPYLKNVGIKYISTPFICMKGLLPSAEYYGIEEGVLTVNRGVDLFPWDVSDCHPEGNIAGPICGMHWPTLLHPDTERNQEVINRWVDHLRQYDERPNRMLSPNTCDCWTQLWYHTHTNLTEGPSGAELKIDPDNKQDVIGLSDTFSVKIRSDRPLQLGSDSEITSSKWKPDLNMHVFRIKPLHPEITLFEIQDGKK